MNSFGHPRDDSERVMTWAEWAKYLGFKDEAALWRAVGRD